MKFQQNQVKLLIIRLCFSLINILHNVDSSFIQLQYFSERKLIFTRDIDRLFALESPLDVDTIRVRGRVTYDGSRFQGWQTQQQKGRTAQGEIESTLSRRLNRKVKIVGASRTDAGVHAKGQALHFDLHKNDNITTENDFTSLEYSINKMLPPDVKVWNLSVAPTPPSSSLLDNWHAIISSKQKLYSYYISTRKALDPLQRYTRSHIHQPVNITKFKRILQYYKGTHDFRAFSGAIESNQRKKNKASTNTTRTIYDIQLVEEEVDDNDERTGLYRIDILLNGALYKMIRNMIGTALDLCLIHDDEYLNKNFKRQRITEELFLDLLHQRRVDKSESDGDSKKQIVLSTRDDNPSKPAPPEGLTLEWVFYDDDF